MNIRIFNKTLSLSLYIYIYHSDIPGEHAGE